MIGVRGVKTYRRRPTNIEALQWTGENAEQIREWVGTGPGRDHPIQKFDWHGRFDRPCPPARLFVDANDSWVSLDIGEWIAKDTKGFYPIKDEVFQSVYHEVDDG